MSANEIKEKAIKTLETIRSLANYNSTDDEANDRFGKIRVIVDKALSEIEKSPV
jgi:hypothetical protein